MQTGFLVIVTLLTVAQLALPRRLAFLPLVIAGAHLGNLELLPELTAARLLILIGLVRAMAGGHLVWPTTKSRLDVLFIAFSGFALLSTIGHKADEWIPSPFNARAGIVLNVLGTYLYGRTYLPDLATFRRYAILLPVILLPLAFGMILEQRTRQNMYYSFGAVREQAAVREDRARAQGPFRHPILAGCAGATALPFAYLAWRLGNRMTAIVGALACFGVVMGCASSGPLAAVAVTVFFIVFWRWRHLFRKLMWGAAFVALVYNLVKGRGPWYLMASIDLVGGSTGWHRAKLIDQGFVYLNEWWLWGTDYTRHWMSSGVRWNPNMVDLTNYYLHLGVTGGLPLTLCLMGFLVVGFGSLSKGMRILRARDDKDEIVLWCAAASLATHAVSFISISYFDQMYIYFYLLVGAIPGLVASVDSKPIEEPTAPIETLQPTPTVPRYYA